MGVHTQGESGFFDDDSDELPAMVQNESIEQHETANATVVNLTGRGRVDMSNFELLKVLGTGAYGKVFLVRKQGGNDHGTLYAMKVLKKASIVQKKKTAEHTMTERQVLEAVRQSPFLVTLYYAFQTDAKLHLILDYVSGGELFTHLYQRERFAENEVRIYIAEIILALEHLHKLGIIYRDIKLENILLDSQGHIVLTDFGLSKEFLPHEKNTRAYSFCGTIEYMAPEIVRGGGAGHDMAVDWWGVGVLTYELLTGASPFTVEGEKNNQQEISRRILSIHPPIPGELSMEVKDFISQLLTKDPSRRLGGGPSDAAELKQHSFFRNLNWDEVGKKLVRAPFIPRIADELDVSNFAEEFTGMAATDSPAIVPANVDKIFKGYSYIAPSILFTDNIISEDLFAISADNKPTLSNIIGARFKNSTFFLHYHMDLREQMLGDGSFSICRRCVHKASGQEMAVKIVSRRLDCSQEISLLRSCQGHPNVVRLHDVFYDEAHTYIVMELLKGGELLQRIRHQKQFTESQAARIWQKLVAGVHHVHSKGIVHRDLKPENLLFESTEEDAELKIVDFGFARFKPEPQKLLNTPCFTLQYAAPEVLKTALVPKDGRYENGYDESCDLWSLGVILYTMLSGRAPFHANGREGNASAVMQRIKTGDFDFDGDAWKHVSSRAKNIVQGLLTVDPQKRLTLNEVMASSWLVPKIREPPLGFTPLMTPGILSIRSFAKTTELAVKQTIDAFHMAAREGFRLQDVCNARLAQRRKAKRSSNDARSVSTSSSFSSSSSGNSSMRTASKGEGSASWSSVGFTPRKMTSEDDNVFSFREARVQEYLSSLSEAESSSRDSFHKLQDKEESRSTKNSWGNGICDSLPSVVDDKIKEAPPAQDLSLPGPSSNDSIILMPISSSTRSKKRQPIKMLLHTNPLGQRGEMNCEEDASLACTKSWKQHQEYSGATEFERPLTRARKRHMAHVNDVQPYIQPIPKRRKNL
ncbi:ribosomal protein S6 kinase alpha-5 isoform X1 [Daphnia magna]|uniref:Ribosomal protein S6 kinase alpha-5 n=1 Tax=Daphnia magna TaxID=35525 RepID=A0ABR0AZA6_9CRUS|nr:ribosomal protein S6 kinase alpha-5 isoform X1 [Daphnia magna]KAK4030359.1 hypothetical protein OUZ56_023358 [Daphnia magna]